VKLCRFVKPVPSVLTANTVPLPELPPSLAVPYRMLPDIIKPASGLAPSLPLVKLCRFVKLEPSVLRANTVPLPPLPPCAAVPYRVLPDEIKPASGEAPSLLVKLCRVVKVCAIARPVSTKPRPAITEST